MSKIWCPIMFPKGPLVNIQFLLSRTHMQHWIANTGPCPASPHLGLCTSCVHPGSVLERTSLISPLLGNSLFGSDGGREKRNLHPSTETFCPGVQNSHVMVPAAFLLAICFPPPTMFQPLCVLCKLIPHPSSIS